MSDKEMDRLPERSVTGLNKKVKLRTIISGLVSDLGPRLRGLVGRIRRR
jgi:hypothetical protein